MKGEVAMPTIFPREEKAEQLFEKILKNPDACERLKETFFDNLPDVDNPEADTRDVTGVTFTRALFQAYENKDLSAFLMAVCGNSMFDLLRNSFLIPIQTRSCLPMKQAVCVRISGSTFRKRPIRNF